MNYLSAPTTLSVPTISRNILDRVEEHLPNSSPDRALIRDRTSELVILDAQLDYLEDLIAGIASTIPVALLSPDRDGIVQIGEILRDRTNITALHILSHGAPGVLQLGNSYLTRVALTDDAEQIRQWRSAFSRDAEILLYGCRLAAHPTIPGAIQTNLLQQLQELTGARIAAASGTVGDRTQGGNWTLDVQTGEIHTAIAITPDAQNTYPGLLATFTVNTSSDIVNPNDGVLSLREAINSARGSAGRDTISIATNVNLTSELILDRGNDIDFVGNDSLPVISGLGRTRIFRVDNSNVSFQGLTLSAGFAPGKNGSNGGGGSGGFGGALFVNSGTVSVNNVTFQNNVAQGGNSLQLAGSGGSGGNDSGNGFSGGNGGRGGEVSIPLTSTSGTITIPLFNGGGGAGGTASQLFLLAGKVSSAGTGGNGGPGEFSGGGGAGGGGGGGAGGGGLGNPGISGGAGGNGGAGGFGGGGGGGGGSGGGGANVLTGPAGGSSNPGTGGSGGQFGGNGNGGSRGSNGSVTFFGDSPGAGGRGGQGGGGAGLGGAVFINSGTVGIANSRFIANRASGGTGFQNGQGVAAAIFNRSGNLSTSNLTFDRNNASSGSGSANIFGIFRNFSVPAVKVSSPTLHPEKSPLTSNLLASFSVNVAPVVDTTVNYTVSGTATAGEDFAPLSGSVVIPARSSVVRIPIEILDDRVFDPDETLTIALKPGLGYTINQAQPSTTLTITDDELSEVSGTDADDSLVGTAIAEQINGNAGNDTIDGNGGNDLIFGDAGDDRIICDRDDGSDVIDGGEGNDTLVFNFSDRDAFLEVQSASDNTLQLLSNQSAATFNLQAKDTEQLDINCLEGSNNVLIRNTIGTVNSIRVTGGAGNNLINGTEASAFLSLSGGNGDDSMGGGSSNDTLTGGNGNDLLLGSGGDDILVGDAGVDTLTGGAGADTFRLALGDSLLDNFDLIADFQIGSDRIEGPTAVTADQIVKLGSVASLDAEAIGTLLSATAFEADRGATFSFGNRTFLALNDGNAGFAASTDAILEITGFSGNLDNLQVFSSSVLPSSVL
jgi:Ca2+-binding RTX toxin-like protein